MVERTDTSRLSKWKANLEKRYAQLIPKIHNIQVEESRNVFLVSRLLCYTVEIGQLGVELLST